MRTKHLIIIFLTTAFVAILVACASKEVTKTEGATSGQAATTSSALQTEKIDLQDINFDFDKYNLRPGDKKILSSHAEYLLKNKHMRIVIEGNCDERGTKEYNMVLGDKRAKEAKKYLVRSGVASKRIKTISYGKERPLDPGHDEEAWAKNRRDHFVAN